MGEYIPIMCDRDVKKSYAIQLEDALGENAFWNIYPANFVFGLIVSPKDATKMKDNGCKNIEKIFIVGIPPVDSQREFRGVNVVAFQPHKKTDFYDSLAGEMGYSGPKELKLLSTFEKPINSTEDLIGELKALEALVMRE